MGHTPTFFMKEVSIMSELVIIRKEGLTLTSPELNAKTDAIIARFDKYRSETAGLLSKAHKAYESAGRDIGKILAEVESSGCYKVDGFTTVPQYAKAVLGMPISTASALLRYGAMLNDKDFPAEVKALPWSNYDAVKSAGKEEIIKGFQNGEINSNSTQRELKDFAAKVNANKPKKAKVLPRFNVTNLYSGKAYSGITEGEVDDTMRQVYGDIEIVKLPAAEGENAPVLRKLYIAPDSAIIMHFFKYDEKSTKAVKEGYVNRAKAKRMIRNGMELEDINDILGTNYTEDDYAVMCDELAELESAETAGLV